MKPIRIAGAGSAIADYLYDHVDFEDDAFSKYRSATSGDGGLEPGKLVLTEDFESFCGVDVQTALNEIVAGSDHSSVNVGGPTIAALINTAQMLNSHDVDVSFYATNGSDEAGSIIRSILHRTPVNTTHFVDVPGSAPFTLVLSDPNFGGTGERTFLNNIGSSWKMSPERLDDAFYSADLRLFGGTALVPPIHEKLTSLLERARHPDRLSVVVTVYDFPNEKKSPGNHWPLGESNDSYRLMDLLIADAEEALRLSGTNDLSDAKRVLIDRGLDALVVTRGTEDVMIFSSGKRFRRTDTHIPISRTNATERGDSPWDTTGCGDNFAGAVLYSLAEQMASDAAPLDLEVACSWGVAAGDFACYFLGGTYLETLPGEKMQRISSIHRRYEAQR